LNFYLIFNQLQIVYFVYSFSIQVSVCCFMLEIDVHWMIVLCLNLVSNFLDRYKIIIFKIPAK
jgi:hypothetical protein